ncbi:MAG TPA: hypothetical protein VMI35_05235 [Puia sp.]|nr:hypothetical protein [Puia sp.]
MRKTNQISKVLFLFSVCFSSLLLCSLDSQAQFMFNNDSAFKAGTPNSGRLWGYAFGDLFYKPHSDSLNRGGSNQYTGVAANTTAFQFRRIYLGYDYNISKKFIAELLLAAEDDFAGGDILTNTKFAPYVKYADIRWRDFLFKGNELVFGMSPTPTFPYLTEYIWNYRSIERTITDIRRTGSYDFGLSLVGRFFSKDNSTMWGYNLMVANGQSDKPYSGQYRWFYGDVFLGVLQHRLVFDLYADYDRIHWSPGFHNARQMTKGYVAWTTPGLTIGVEGYINNLTQNAVGTHTVGGAKDTLNQVAQGISFYIHGNIIPDKLRYFARFDSYNPNTKYDNTTYTKYTSFISQYEPNNKEHFLTAGLDFMPIKNVHFMPNVWYNNYVSQQANQMGKAAKDHDLVWRMTFYFVFGKTFAWPQNEYYK